MANRYKPVNGKGSKLPLHRDGAFVLTDVDGSITWEANTRTTYVERAELLDNGNLVLKNSSGKVVWQSFDFPTDTLLPHQRFTKSKKLISILGRGNYGTGYFNFFFDTDNVLRLVYDGPDISSVYWPNVDFDAFGNGRTNFNSTRIAMLDDMGWFLSSDWLNFNGSVDSFSINKSRIE
ncbi:putative receptor protein kinase ZmPK1 [Gossypium hirsutum]|uniref:Receptor protein kinase ZmPK1 n=1 Tax=Gossypium hirsutum TaxID=3635 RepID=A0ABM3APU3_GOSHI|nr:putative receptor protein kinase ZmPK1 [Gossypium hirsutum]